MAYIDKTYFSTYEQWKQVRDWCDDKIVEFNKTQIYHVKNYLYYTDLTEVEFNSYKEEFIKSHCKNYNTTREEALNNFSMVLWNTPVWLDIWLIRNCPINFIQDRLKCQYGDEYAQIKNKTSRYDTYKRNGLGKNFHYKIICKPNWKPRYNFHCINRFDNDNYYKEKQTPWWFIAIEDTKIKNSISWFANTKYNYWTNSEEGLPFDSNMMNIKRKNLNIHAIIRMIKKWNLPAGSQVKVLNNYFNYGWIINIKK